MWTAYKEWFEEYNASPKMKIDLQTFDLDQPGNIDRVLQQIDATLNDIRQPQS